jgi:hypothetical protein
MLCLFEDDYMFDSGKFEDWFGVTATAPFLGVKSMVADLWNRTLKG